MDSYKLKGLLLKYLQNNLTPQESIEFQHLINVVEPQELYDLYNQLNLSDSFSEDLYQNYDHQGILNAITAKIERSKKRNNNYLYFEIALVSILLLYFLFSPFFYSTFDKKNELFPSISENNISLFDTIGVKLQLADGEVIDFDKKATDSTIYKNGYLIEFNKGTVEYKIDKTIAKKYNHTVGINIFSTQKGVRSSISLEDGTKVWLNSGSILKFPTTFMTQNERIVEVVGEAYFEVARNKNKPFLVVSKQSKIIVLGTKFNVKSLADTEEVQTTLIEGSVSINTGNLSHILKPGEQALVQTNGNLNVSRVNVDDFLAWRSGILKFNNLQIKDIIKELSRWYDIQGIENRSHNKEKYTGSLTKNNDLKIILKQLEHISNTKLIIKERRILIED